MSEKPRHPYVAGVSVDMSRAQSYVIFRGKRFSVPPEVLSWSGMKVEQVIETGTTHAVHLTDGRRVKLEEVAAVDGVPLDPATAEERCRVLGLVDHLMLSHFSQLSEAERARFEELQALIISGKYRELDWPTE